MTMHQIRTTRDATAIERFVALAMSEVSEARYNLDHQVGRDGAATTLLVFKSPTFNGSVRLSGEGKRIQFGKN